MKFYNYSIKKNIHAEPFKPFITEKAIYEESEEIEKFCESKIGNSSHDRSSEESVLEREARQSGSSDEQPALEPTPDVPPPLPKKLPTAPQKPSIPPKPMSVIVKPPRTTKPSASLNKPMHDLRIIGDKGSEDNDNNFDHNHLYDNTKSVMVGKKPEFMPTDRSNNNTFIEHEVASDDEPILRPKKPYQRAAKTDEEVYTELRSICNMSDPLRKYSKTKEVGKGASGVVFIATDLETQKQVAIKTIDLKQQSSKELILNEIRVLSDFNHKNLVNFLEAYFLEELDTLWVVLEYMNGWVKVLSPSCI